jgi:hypothetical protein
MNERGYVIFELLIAFLLISLLIGTSYSYWGPLKDSVQLRLSQWQLLNQLHAGRERSKSHFLDTFITTYPNKIETTSSSTSGPGFTPYGRSKSGTTLDMSISGISGRVVLTPVYGKVRIE